MITQSWITKGRFIYPNAIWDFSHPCTAFGDHGVSCPVRQIQLWVTTSSCLGLVNLGHVSHLRAGEQLCAGKVPQRSGGCCFGKKKMLFGSQLIISAPKMIRKLKDVSVGFERIQLAQYFPSTISFWSSLQKMLSNFLSLLTSITFLGRSLCLNSFLLSANKSKENKVN